ncbi:MAG: STAS domain-containing protein [Selenomonadaceae bacterium]|nr:STAS domain-containing protein [Selenomonadaceae bacterium]
MAREGITYETHEKNGWTVWEIKGSIDMTTANAAEEKGGKLLTDSSRLAIDMAGVEYLSSAGLRILLRLAKRAKKEGKGFALVAAQGMVATVLKESRMDMIISIVSSLDEL